MARSKSPMISLEEAKALSRQPAPEEFVELLAPPAQSRRECTFELEDRRGKLKILLTGASASELAALIRALWETFA